MTLKNHIFYQLWSEKNITTILSDIDTYQPKNITIFGVEEWEIGGILYHDGFLNELQTKLETNNIDLHIVFGSEDDTEFFYRNYDMLPKKNTKIIKWPMFWLYNTHNNLVTKNLNTYNSSDIDYDIDKLFMSLNNKSTKHRCLLMDKLCENNLINYGNISWMEPETINHEWECWEPKKLILDEEYPKSLDSYVTIPHEYKKVLVNLIPESTTNVPFLTEKTFTSILLNQPFLILGSANIHKTLVNHGFELYNEIFDYSFDSLIDTNERIDGIITNLKNVKDSDYNELRLKIKDKILRNKNNALDIINNKKFIPEYVKSIGETYRDEFGNYIFSKFI
jgi:hypothetical protein